MRIYSIKTLRQFDKQLSKLDRGTRRLLSAWITKNLYHTENPRQHGKALRGNHSGEWRYRIGDYRLIVEIKDDELIILALAVGHRRNIYER